MSITKQNRNISFTPIWMHGNFIIIFEQFTIFSNLITVLLNWGNSIIIWDIFNSLITLSALLQERPYMVMEQ